jgi:hypothetical protein
MLRPPVQKLADDVVTAALQMCSFYRSTVRHQGVQDWGSSWHTSPANTCHHSVQNLLSPSAPSINLKTKIIKKITCSFLSIYPLYKTLAGLRSRSGLYGEEANLLPLPGIEPQLLGRPARSLIATQTGLSRILVL